MPAAIPTSGRGIELLLGLGRGHRLHLYSGHAVCDQGPECVAPSRAMGAAWPRPTDTKIPNVAKLASIAVRPLLRKSVTTPESGSTPSDQQDLQRRRGTAQTGNFLPGGPPLSAQRRKRGVSRRPPRKLPRSKLKLRRSAPPHRSRYLVHRFCLLRPATIFFISSAKSDQPNLSVGNCFPVLVSILALLAHHANEPWPILMVPSWGPRFSGPPLSNTLISIPAFRAVFLPRSKLSNSVTSATCLSILGMRSFHRS